MWNNRKYYNGLSVLPYNGGTYQRKPFEDCDEETYNKMMKSLNNVDLSKVVELTDNTGLCGWVESLEAQRSEIIDTFITESPILKCGVFINKIYI